MIFADFPTHDELRDFFTESSADLDSIPQVVESRADHYSSNPTTGPERTTP